MRRVFLGTVTVLLAMVVLVGEGFSNNYSPGSGGCTSIWRVSHDYATCLKARSTKTPFQYWIQNLCYEYGSMLVNIDVKDFLDDSWVLDEEGEETELVYNEIRDMSCCINHSDICHKNQVEKNSQGRITSITISGSNIGQTTVDVSTHELRYEFCRDNSTNIYCKVDPDGDAHTVPASMQGHPCGTDGCSPTECLSEFAKSPAADECTNASAETVFQATGDCHIDADCVNPTTGSTESVSANYVDYDDLSDLDACVRSSGWGFGLYDESTC